MSLSFLLGPKLLGLFILFLVTLCPTWGMYCGHQNCYDVLKVRESATKAEITAAYRKLARDAHPDKNPHRLEEADKEFSAISHAYTILKSDESRREYDYALRHPEYFAYNQARYYARQYYTRHFQFNPLLVLLVSLGLWSAFEYSSRMMVYKQAIQNVKQTPEYKIRLKRFKEEKVAEMEKQGLIKKKMNGKRSKKDLEAIDVDEKELEEQIQVHGSYRKPEIYELAFIQFWLLPYKLCSSVWWHVRWFIKYTINKEEYSDEDKEYIVRGILNLSEKTFQGLEDKQREKIMARQLWIPENEAKYRQAQRAAAQGQGLDFDD